jgi:hypothetical protein
LHGGLSCIPSFLRGLATNRRALGVDDLTVMEILRHSDVSVTRGGYITRFNEKSVEAMGGLKPRFASPYKVSGKARRRRRRLRGRTLSFR